MPETILHELLSFMLRIAFTIEEDNKEELEKIINDEDIPLSERANRYIDFIVKQIIEKFPKEIFDD